MRPDNNLQRAAGPAATHAPPSLASLPLPLPLRFALRSMPGDCFRSIGGANFAVSRRRIRAHRHELYVEIAAYITSRRG